ncbi:MAG TPA: SWIM zinc finger family protein [Drouetiella sp.]
MSHDDIYNSRFGPRIARGGIKSQTTRGSFGKTWWAQRWINYLESFELGGRLARGRNYARKGQVLDIEIQEGVIAARVQGSRFEPYRVKIEVKTIPSDKWDELASAEFSQAILAARLLAGEMPQDIEKIFAKHELSLFPQHELDFKTYCTCPDFQNPCKHIASVYYLLGEEFDRDPFLIFKMRGMAKDNLIGLITRSADPAASSSSLVDVDKKSPRRRAKKGTAVSTLDSPDNTDLSGEVPGNRKKSHEHGRVPLDLDSFWDIPVMDEATETVSAPKSNGDLVKRLGPFSFWRSSHPFIPTMEEVYKVGTKDQLKLFL